MARSPLLERAGNIDANGITAKSSVKPAANGTNGSTSNTSPAKKQTGDLTEQLNEEIKRRYEKETKIGEGTYATVWRSHLKSDPSRLVAIKKIKVNVENKDGIPPDVLREIKFLQELSHPNVVAMDAIYSSKGGNLNLVLEYLPRGDLEMLIRDTTNIYYGAADIKTWMGMTCRAVWFIHENFVLHRDIKPNNLLIAADGQIKLADFGLARSFADPTVRMTHLVITRWYRPPELFYRAKHYSGAVDIWSVGCVFAELILRAPFMAGETDIHQLEIIQQAIGTPTEDNWPGVSQLDGYIAPAKADIKPVRGKPAFMQLFGSQGSVAVELLMSMMKLDPRKRITARQTLQHEYWSINPKPTRIEELPRKAGGEKKMAETLQKKPGELEQPRGDKIARKIDFSAAR